jgi:membrane associated rhomboid family serine protease
MSIFRDLRIGLNGSNGALIRLIFINCVVFLAANIIMNIFDDTAGANPELVVSPWLNLPSNLSVFPGRFWTLFTYMFVHYDIRHLLSNMLWLYYLGRIFSNTLGGARMTAVYILGGLSGGLLFLVIDNLLPRGGHSELIGASAGVMAIVVGIAAYSPDALIYPFGIAMRLKWLALIAFVITSLIDLSANTGGKVSHIGGAVFGFLYGTQLRRGKKFLEGFSRLFRFKSRHLRVEYSTRSQRSNDELYNMTKTSIRKRVDEILDKISRSGYDSLSKDEKEFLKENHDKF